jgi:hypothetical protein
VAIVAGVTMVLACFTADIIDFAVDLSDPAVIVGSETARAEAHVLQPRGAQPQPSGDEYPSRLYRADLRRPKQWGS